MSAYQYTNNASTTVGASYTSGGGSLQVASTAGNFPAAAPFHIIVLDQSTNALKVIHKVTAITDGTHFAVTAEGSDANLASGDLVYGVIFTKDGLDLIRADINRVTTGAKPTDQRNGDNINPTDDIVRQIYAGGAWNCFGPHFPCTDPTLQTWAWRNQGGATVTNYTASIHLEGTAVSGVNLRCRETSCPATPWTATAILIPRLFAVNFHSCGIYVRDSVGGKMVTILLGQTSGIPQIQCANFDNETTFNAQAVTPQNVNHLSPLILRITDDGTNLKYFWSTNGLDFIQFFSGVRHVFLAAGPDKVGFFVDVENTTLAAAASLISWKFT